MYSPSHSMRTSHPPPPSTILSNSTYPYQSTATPCSVSAGSSYLYPSTYFSGSRATSSTQQLIPGSSVASRTGHTDDFTFDDSEKKKDGNGEKKKYGKLKRFGRKLLDGVKRLIVPRQKEDNPRGAGINIWMDGVSEGRTKSSGTGWNGDSLEEESLLETQTASAEDYMTRHEGSSTAEIRSQSGGRWGKGSAAGQESTCAESSCTCSSCVREFGINRATFAGSVAETAAWAKQKKSVQGGGSEMGRGSSKIHTAKNESTYSESTCTCSSCALEDTSASGNSDKGKPTPTKRTNNTKQSSLNRGGSSCKHTSTCAESTCTCTSCAREAKASTSGSDNKNRSSAKKTKESSQGRSAGSVSRTTPRESYLVALFVPEFSRKELRKKRQNQAGNIRQ